jgi:hypothetical protein
VDIYNKKLDIDWKLVHLICAIERFDACWPSVERREAGMLKGMKVNPQDAALLLDQQLDTTPELRFWYETDIDTPAIVKCAVFCAEQGYQFTRAFLLKQGYGWADYIDLQKVLEYQPAENIGFTERVTIFLTCLRNAQEQLSQALDAGGTQQSYTLKEKQLLHTIQSYPGIKTSGISKKLGVSISTTKRMLGRLITAQLVERQGTGPGSHYTIT